MINSFICCVGEKRRQKKDKSEKKRIFACFFVVVVGWLALKESKFDMGSFRCSNVYRTHFNSLVKKGSGTIHSVKNSRKIIFVLDKSCGKFFHRKYTRTVFWREREREKNLPTFLTFYLSSF